MLQHADELSLLQAQIVYKKRLDAVMRELTAQESALSQKVAQLEASMHQEQKDVERLEQHSLAVFFYQLTGQMNTILDKERREAYAARIKYDTALRELDAVREDILETQADLEDLRDCEARYAQVLEKKKQELAHSSDPNGILLLEKEQYIGYLTQQKSELEEAVEAGTTALRTMAELQQSLHSAKEWSLETKTPAFWADHARQEQLETAREQVDRLQIQMQRFNKELSDVTIRPNLQGSIHRMLKFADDLFDDLRRDVPASERIRQSCFLADQTRECILSVLRQLQNALEEVRHNYTRTRQEMDAIVLQAINE